MIEKYITFRVYADIIGTALGIAALIYVMIQVFLIYRKRNKEIEKNKKRYKRGK